MGYWERYDAYMRSPQWRLVRAQVIERDKGECRMCGARERLTVHHLTYARIFREWLDDLITLCFHCHEKRHRPISAPAACMPRKKKQNHTCRVIKNRKKQRADRADRKNRPYYWDDKSEEEIV